jgi:hypothetical protein
VRSAISEKYGVNLEWLLEGEERIFKKDMIRLVREVLQERNQ